MRSCAHTMEAGGGRWLGVLPYHTFCPTSLRQGLSLNLTFFVSARLTGQHASGILLSAPCHMFGAPLWSRMGLLSGTQLKAMVVLPARGHQLPII